MFSYIYIYIYIYLVIIMIYHDALHLAKRCFSVCLCLSPVSLSDCLFICLSVCLFSLYLSLSLSIYILGWFTDAWPKTKCKLETKAPSQFVRPINSII